MAQLTEELSTRRWLVAVGAFLGMVSFSISRHLYQYVLRPMATDLDLPYERMGNIASSYFVAYAAASLAWGIVADAVGSRRAMLLGVGLIAAGLTGMGFASSFATAFVPYLLCGAGAAGLSVPQVPLLSSWFPANRRGLAMGIAITGSGFGSFALGLVVPTVVAATNWRTAWSLAGGVALVFLVICWWLLAESPTARKQRSARRATAAQRPLAAGGMLRGSADVFRQATFWNLAAIYGLFGAGYAIFITFAVAYLQEQAWTAAAAGGAAAVWGAGYMVGPTLWGSLADRIAKKWVFAISLLVQCCGLLLFLTADPVGSIVGAAAMGFGLIAIPTGMSAAASDYFPVRITGLAFGLLTLTFGLVSVIAPTIGGMVSDATGTLRSAILLGTAMVAVALVAALLLGKPPAAGSGSRTAVPQRRDELSTDLGTD